MTTMADVARFWLDTLTRLTRQVLTDPAHFCRLAFLVIVADGVLTQLVVHVVACQTLTCCINLDLN
jgi:hypothetical protein